MNMVTIAGQKIHDMYVSLGNTTTLDPPCVVIYALNQQAKVSQVCFHDIDTANALMCFELSDTLSETEWLAMRQPDGQPYRMTPYLVQAIDGLLSTLTCTALQYQSLVGAFTDLVHFHKLKQTDKIDRVAGGIPLQGGKIALKAVITDIPTETWWLAEVTSVSTRTDGLAFDTA
jgi:hypothetical protein